MKLKNEQILDDVVKILREKFPQLRIIEYNEAPVERAYHIPAQEGIVCDLHLNLQNEDELHLNIGKYFWCEWFSCEKECVVQDYLDSVIGFIEGTYRVVDYFSGSTCYKSVLEKKEKDLWQPYASSIHVHGYVWPGWRKRTEITRNTKPVIGGDANR
jgi:hypothetical protein